jgi:hypothetical protein
VKWTADELCKVILVSTIPVTVVAIVIMRISGVSALSEGAAGMIFDLLTKILLFVSGLKAGEIISKKPD